MNKSLYQIDAELQRIVDEIIDAGGEITPELEEQLAITQDNLNEKLDNYRKLFTMIESRALACKTENNVLKFFRNLVSVPLRSLKMLCLKLYLNGVIPIRVVIRLLS